MTSALRIKQALPAATVTVVAEQLEDTTSHCAGGLWKPYTLGDTPPELVNRWGCDTLDHYLALYQSPEAPAAGAVLTSAYQLFRQPVPDPEWAQVVPHFRHMSERERQVLDPEGSHSHGWFYTTVITEGRLYMGWLAQQLAAAGGQRLERRVEAVEELAGHDVVVNCTGLGAKALFGDDSCYPVRGHVLRVRAPWVRHYTNSENAPGEESTYIIPNSETVVLGGTLGPNDWDTTPREADRRRIYERACAVLPSLRSAEIVAEWVGLRPGRPSVRLELEEAQLKSGSRKPSLPIVHNYGHGGAGLTLAWGCAGDAAQLVQQALARR